MSAKQCHGKHLPCSVNDTSLCVTQDEVRPSFALVFTKSRRIIGRYGLPAWELGVFLPVPWRTWFCRLLSSSLRSLCPWAQVASHGCHAGQIQTKICSQCMITSQMLTQVNIGRLTKCFNRSGRSWWVNFSSSWLAPDRRYGMARHGIGGGVWTLQKCLWSTILHPCFVVWPTNEDFYSIGYPGYDQDWGFLFA